VNFRDRQRAARLLQHLKNRFALPGLSSFYQRSFCCESPPTRS
jgi:hypothetical protein